MELKDEKSKLSYALGMDMANYLGSMPVTIDFPTLAQAILDTTGGKPALSPEEFQRVMSAFHKEMQEKSKQRLADIAAANKAEGEKFLAENGKKPGVKTTASGLQYTVITEGEGVSPKADSQVKVHYTGTLLSGQVFDSSVQRGEPAVFGVNQVIPGWTEALKLMKVGSKYKLFIPSDLAYGPNGAGQVIPPNATLVFEVELLEVL